METIVELLPILLPLFIIQLILVIVALVAWFKTDQTRGSKWAWLLIILALNIIGPVLFFIFGRSTD